MDDEDDSPIRDRQFPRGGHDFEAFYDCQSWLSGHGCSIGSLQRSAAVGVIFEPGHDIAKHRNLSGSDRLDMHGWITFPGGVGPRDGDVAFIITRLGHQFLEARLLTTKVPE